MVKTRSHLLFNRQQRGGILFLVLLISVSLALYFLTNPSGDTRWDISSPKIEMARKKMESLRVARLKKAEPEIYPFNPNFITDYKAYTLGMSTREFDRLKEFRDEGNWVNSAEDFQRVTGISDSLLAEIGPNFKFPEWVGKNNRRSRSKSYKFKSPPSKRSDLNKATAAELQQVRGIGPVFSERIISTREQLGGFRDMVQLYAVYGLKEEVFQELSKYFKIEEGEEIQGMNINTASASDIATIPGISFEMAKDIWDFRRLRETISELSELQKIEGMSESKFRLIELYLFAE